MPDIIDGITFCDTIISIVIRILENYTEAGRPLNMSTIIKMPSRN